MSESREQQVRHFEELAEWLAAEQLDLLAQLEAQLRAVHHTMRRIATLRSKEHRRETEDEPTDGERKLALNGLAGEIQGLDEHVNTQAECCQAMLSTVAKMQRRLSQMKESGFVTSDGADRTSPSDATE